MDQLINFHFIVFFAILIWFGVNAYTSAKTRATVQAVLYAIVALLALIAIIVMFIVN